MPNVWRVMLLHFKKVTVVNDVINNVADVVGLVRRFWNYGIQLDVGAIGWVRRLSRGGSSTIV